MFVGYKKKHVLVDQSSPVSLLPHPAQSTLLAAGTNVDGKMPECRGAGW
jgi:hypothetical protein